MLCYLGHLCVPSSEPEKMIWEVHYSLAAGHFGVEKIVEILQKYFYWPNLQKDVGKYIISYTVCGISKSTFKKQGLYTPFPTPSWPCESISMDYMSSLPSTKHDNDCVFVVIDKFSKMAIMATCKKNITVEATAKLFFERVWVQFGPHSLSSQIGIVGSSVHFCLVSGRLWTPISLSPQLSIPKFMARKRSSIGWSYTFFTCTTQSIHAHGMRGSPMSNTDITRLSIAQLTTTLFRWAWDSSHYAPLMWP